MAKLDKKEILDDIGKYKAIEALLNFEGGKLLVETAHKDIVNSMDLLASSYKTATHADLIALCANLKANLDMLRVFKNAKTNRELAEEALKSLEEH